MHFVDWLALGVIGFYLLTWWVVTGANEDI